MGMTADEFNNAVQEWIKCTKLKKLQFQNLQQKIELYAYRIF